MRQRCPVVNAVKADMPRMQEAVPLKTSMCSYVFDQSPYVTRAMWGVAAKVCSAPC